MSPYIALDLRLAYELSHTALYLFLFIRRGSNPEGKFRFNTILGRVGDRLYLKKDSFYAAKKELEQKGICHFNPAPRRADGTYAYNGTQSSGCIDPRFLPDYLKQEDGFLKISTEVAQLVSSTQEMKDFKFLILKEHFKALYGSISASSLIDILKRSTGKTLSFPVAKRVFQSALQPFYRRKTEMVSGADVRKSAQKQGRPNEAPVDSPNDSYGKNFIELQYRDLNPNQVFQLHKKEYAGISAAFDQLEEQYAFSDFLKIPAKTKNLLFVCTYVASRKIDICKGFQYKRLLEEAIGCYHRIKQTKKATTKSFKNRLLKVMEKEFYYANFWGFLKAYNMVG